MQLSLEDFAEGKADGAGLVTLEAHLDLSRIGAQKRNARDLGPVLGSIMCCYDFRGEERDLPRCRAQRVWQGNAEEIGRQSGLNGTGSGIGICNSTVSQTHKNSTYNTLPCRSSQQLCMGIIFSAILPEGLPGGSIQQRQDGSPFLAHQKDLGRKLFEQV